VIPLGDSVRRALLAAGTATYWHKDTFTDGLDNLDAVPGELRTVVASLTQLGYKPEHDCDGFLLDPDVKVLRSAIRSLARHAQVAVLYYTGHGLKQEKSPYYVLTSDSNANELEDTALEAKQVLSLLLRRDEGRPTDEQPQVLVVLDCCYSGAGGIEALRDSLQDLGNSNVWVLATALDEHEAQQGVFAQALAEALAEPNTGHLPEFVHPQVVAEQIDKRLGRGGAMQRTALIPPRGQLRGTPPPFFPNPDYFPGVVGLTVEEHRAWVNRLHAAPEGSTATGFYVTGSTGRIRAIHDMAAWMRGPDDHRLAVVTGSPGSGKSTLLALPAMLAEPNQAAQLLARPPADSLLSAAAKLFNGLPVVSWSARGKNPYEAAASIANQMDRKAESPKELLDVLSEQPAAASRIVVIDAVDEAVDPERLLSDLLLPLARLAGIRVLIGTRRHLVPSHGDAGLVIDLDAADYRDPQALIEYVRRLLLATHEPEVHSPYTEAPEAITDSVAQAIADRATATSSAAGRAESFLLAQLLARALRGRQQAVDSAVPGWAELLPTDVGSAFNADLARIGNREGKVRALLSALAWAQGPGLPWEKIWIPVAQALTANSGPAYLALVDSDVRWLLDNAGGYIVEDLGPGQTSAFRPFHEMLAAHLRGEPNRETLLNDPSAAQAWVARSERTEAAITRALLGTVPTDSGGHLDWQQAHPYLRTYLARHAHAASPQNLARLVTDLDFLSIADPSTLTPLLTTADPALREIALAYRRARPLLGTNAADNAAYLQEAFVAETGNSPTTQRIRPSYSTLMASTRRDDSLLTLHGHLSVVESVAFGTDVDEKPVLASAGWDGTVRLWDPKTGSETLNPLDHGGCVRSVAFDNSASTTRMLASGGWDGMVRLWDPHTGSLTRALNHGHRVESIAFGITADGKPMLASAGWDGMVRLWDPVTGDPKGAPLAGHPSPVDSVAFGTGTDGQLILASAGWDNTVRLWNPDTGSQMGDPLNGHTHQTASVAFGTGMEGQLVLASGGRDDTVRLWDPATGASAGGPVAGHRDSVHSVAFGTGTDGQLVLASGGRDDTVRLWDPATGASTGGPFAGHGGTVSSVAFGSWTDGRLILASAGGSGTIRLWDPQNGAGASLGVHLGGVESVAFGTGTDGRLILASAGGDGGIQLWLLDSVSGASAGRQLDGHRSPIASLAFGTGTDGQLVLASASWDSTVRLWDPYTGSEKRDALVGHDGPVASVAFGTGTDGQLILASASWDSTVRLWDPCTGSEIRDPLVGHDGPVASVAFGTGTDGRPTVVSAGSDSTVRLWDPDNRSTPAIIRRRTRARVVAQAGGTLVVGDDEGVFVLQAPH
jgi:WD40 repeat protein/energy-coupling factor transporter ATP-binding protein EcfA2